MRFITTLGVLVLARCINNEMFLSIFSGTDFFIGIFVLIALTMDYIEFIKKIDN